MMGMKSAKVKSETKYRKERIDAGGGKTSIFIAGHFTEPQQNLERGRIVTLDDLLFGFTQLFPRPPRFPLLPQGWPSELFV